MKIKFFLMTEGHSKRKTYSKIKQDSKEKERKNRKTEENMIQKNAYG